MKSIPHDPFQSTQGLQSSAPGGKTRYAQLSAPWRALVRLCQFINYGSIEGLHVDNAEPMLKPPPLVLVDVKLDADEVPRPEVGLSDFELCDGLRRLIAQILKFKEGIVERIEVRAGIPRRVIFRGPPVDLRSGLSDSDHSSSQPIEGHRTQPNGVADHER